jgi:hypothetical protein
MSGLWRAAAAAVSWIVLSTGVAAAQGGSGPTEEIQLVRSGVSLREQGKDQAAYEVFKEAFEKYKTPRSQGHMGLALQALGRWVEAETHVRGALANGQDQWVSNNRKTLEQALAVIEQRLGSLDVISNVPGTEVTVDGRPAGKVPLPMPLRLSAGTVVVQVQAPGHAPLQRAVQISAGQLSRENFDLVRLENRSPLSPSTENPPPAFSAASMTPATGGEVQETAARGAPRGVFYGGLAATGVATALTLWSGLDTLSKRDAYVKEPTKARYDDGVSRERRTNILIGTTVALALGTALIGLLFTDWN